ncbi:M56 family metallopeptidase [Hufsiella ginkgonis]|uniref:Peptidase M56 domain-containing protein n=1 Tax=Hufsiella ginkgonis TaxID=2695274 RepID=A0A7K1XTE7_9SPHI|nr:M56 family metallopeptidase [Hufsiella ginkgonis]MXV14049.1 hypothetical protein [Hufsiella ginkgonis]
MELFLTYVIKVNLVISLLFTAWYVVMRKNKFFRQNRFALLVIIQLSFIMPFAPAILPTTFANQISLETAGSAIPDPLPAVTGSRQVPSYAKAPGAARGRTYVARFLWSTGLLYIFISGLLLLRLVNQLLNVSSIIRKCGKVRSHGVTYCEPADSIAPFSFFNFIVVHRKAYSQEQYVQIISHEYVHSDEWHSVDTLLAELTQILLWPNPLTGLLKRCLRANLEFLADDRVIRSGIDGKAYQLNILRFASARANVSFTTGYSSLIIKERIRMINATQTPEKRRYNSLLLLPLLALGYGVVSPAYAQQNEVPTVAEQAELKAIGGYYGLKYHHDIRIRVSPRDGRLKLLQLWDDHEITFKKQSHLTFYNEEKKFRLDFVKDKEGKIAGVIGMRKDRWIKLRADDPNVKNESKTIREVIAD